MDKDRTAKILDTFIKMIEKEPFLNYDTEDQEDISKSEMISEEPISEETIESIPEETDIEIDSSSDLQAKDSEKEKTIIEPCYVSISTNLPTNEELLVEFSIENESLNEATLLDAKLLMIPAILLKADISLSPSKFSPSLVHQLTEIGFNANLLETTLKSEQCYPLGQSVLIENASGKNKLIELPFSCFQPWSLEIPDLKNASPTLPYESRAYHEVPVSCDPANTIETFENSCLLSSASNFGLLDSLNSLIMENHSFPSLEEEEEEENQLLIDKMRKAEKKVNKAKELLDETKKEKEMALNEAQKRVEMINTIQDQGGNKAKIQQHTLASEQLVKQAMELSSKIKEITSILKKNKSDYEKYSNDLIEISERNGILPSSKELATMILDEIPSLTKEDLQFKLHTCKFFIFSWFITVNLKMENDEKLVHALIFDINNSTKTIKINIVQS
ncbi:MAG: hypothetical protein KAR35_01135 [Candidatus Heimdallarchaeota archaeon]|nr:hypothetical protein [Candidatus Heimdallarchaeota archaeon]MCK5047958.1 hypothetical protein [Candidatus Heimdallarchaeota archaeon]